MNKKATKEEMLFLWMQLKKTVETISNEEMYKGRNWRLRVEWNEDDAGPDVDIWLDTSNINIPAPHFYHTLDPEDEQPKEVEVP